MSQATGPVDLGEYLAATSEPEAELMKVFGRNDELVIMDIGSCEGEDAIRYGRRFPRAKVYAFEPLPSNCAIARANFERYGATNVELVPVALSDRCGEAEFHVSSGRPDELFSGENWNYGNKSSSLFPPEANAPMYGWIEFKDKIVVQCETLESFCASHGIDQVDFIHMDVQGAEHLVLAGAGPVLARTKALWLEVADKRLYQGQKLRAEVGQYMHERRFRLLFESLRGTEGDQFYVNMRFKTMARRLARKKIERLVRAARTRLGALRNRWFSLQ